MAIHREFDITIFGATGFTGKYVLKNLIISNQIENKFWKVAIAGRDGLKLNSILEEVSNELNKNIRDIAIVIANIDDYSSLLKMCQRSKVIFNTVGPFLLYGEVVIQACIEAGTHQVNVCGESLHVEKMQLRYHEEAKKSGVYIISGCGFDSIPAEIGVNLLRDSSPFLLNSIEGYITFYNKSGQNRINHGTWDALLAFIAQRSQVKLIRRKLFKEFYIKPVPNFKYPLKTRYIPFKPYHSEHFCVPFWDSDKACVHRSQMFEYQENGEKPIQFQEYMTLPTLAILPFIGLIGFMLLILAPFNWGRKLLQKHPKFFTLGLFSKEGPTKQDVEGSSFSMTLVGKGWKVNKNESSEPDQPPKEIISAQITGPNLAYETSSICLVQSGITLLEEMDKIPYTGGLLSPGFAFRQTSILERLNRHSVAISLKDL